MELALLADTHIAKQVVLQLRAKGVDILRLEEITELSTSASDAEILAYATSKGRAVLSLDNDFERLHFDYVARDDAHAGIFLGHKRYQGDIGTLVNFIEEYAQLIEDEHDVTNQLIYIR